jgi:hypothetical protein
MNHSASEGAAAGRATAFRGSISSRPIVTVCSVPLRKNLTGYVVRVRRDDKPRKRGGIRCVLFANQRHDIAGKQLTLCGSARQDVGSHRAAAFATSNAAANSGVMR